MALATMLFVKPLICFRELIDWNNSVAAAHSSWTTTNQARLPIHYKHNQRWKQQQHVNAVVTSEILKLLQTYFRELLQLMNIFQHVRCRRNNSEII